MNRFLALAHMPSRAARKQAVMQWRLDGEISAGRAALMLKLFRLEDA